MENCVKLGMACVVWMSLLGTSWADPPASTQYLVLKNGAVISGLITRDGAVYVIVSPGSTGESRYQATMVAKVCDTCNDVYQLLKRSSIPDDSDDHCRLARFCLAHSMMKEAKLEIEEAIKYDRRSSDAQLLLKQWTTQQQAVGKPSIDVPALPKETIPLLPAGSLDDWPAVASPEGRMDFSRRIQPILMMGCGTGACHGVPEGKRGFVLKKGLPGAPIPMHITNTNLERTLGLLNKDVLEASELIKRAQQPHGHIKNWPVSIDHQATLKQWIMYAAGKQEPPRQPDTSVLQTGGAVKKESNEFASGDGASAGTASASANSGSKLPVIPGMSGAAQQQPGQPPATGSSGGGSSVLPPIPGVSGKGQGNNNSNNTPPAERPIKPPEEKTRVPDEAVWEYAKRLGIMPMLPAQKDKPPERLQIVNAGTYRIDTPPVPVVPDEFLEKIKKREADRKGENKDKDANAGSFLRSGTVVNNPKQP